MPRVISATRFRWPRRRHLAAPFVLAAALVPACGPRQASPPDTIHTEPEIRYDQYGNELAPGTDDAAAIESSETIDAGPVTPLPDAPTGVNGRVFVRDDETCWFHYAVECPPKAPCKPPPPLQVNCKN